MPVYIRKDPVDIIPELSESCGDDDEEESFLKDPDQLQDQLPQPFRMIDKIPVSTNCVACSEDGRYIFLGHPSGLSVLDQALGSTSSTVVVWKEDQVEITSLHITCLGETAYLLGALDDMGVARLFAYSSETIHLIKVINETEDINQRSVCAKFELSRGGDYGAATICCNGSQCLEVYRFPKDVWLKELSQHAPGVGAAIRLSPVTMVMKIKPPKPLTGSTMKSPFEVLQKTVDSTVIGSGQNHLISSRQWEEQDALFKSLYRKYLVTNPRLSKDSEDVLRRVTSHFLLPGGLFPALGGYKPQPGEAVAVCLWWNGSHSLLHYLLCTTPKDKTDPEPKPDVLWPNAQEVLCSAVSSCTRFLALGLEGELVTVWDRQLGLPLCVVAVAADSVFSSLTFLEYWPGAGFDEALSQGPDQNQNGTFLGQGTSHINTKVHVLVSCQSGARHIVSAGRGMDSHDVTQLSERPRDSECFPVVTVAVPFLQHLAVVLHRNGQVFLEDVVTRSRVCRLSFPDSHALARPWEPLFLMEPNQQALLIRGDHLPSPDRAEETDDGGSRLFVFRFHDADVVKPYRTGDVLLASSQHGQSATAPSSLEETWNLYFQQRAESVGQRNKVLTQTWNHLQQHAVMVLSQNHRKPPKPQP
ncbi:WD repeat-containing protein 93 isoform X2 [Esox lucius]|uniref:WD repeat-containing protein 93 isoform X2 n=1 Tax=Esox lucius TaxID=8010 RepID=UPI00147787FA|nr:WD repeat-containing protein 93 isoform X2 [Esox lucius]